MSHVVQAMVFVLSHRLLPDAGICIEYCITHGYHMGGVIRDDWAKAVDYLYSGKCEVLVVASDETLDPDRTPRVEVVAHQQGQPQPRPQRPDVPTGRRPSLRRGERTRMIRRTAAR